MGRSSEANAGAIRLLPLFGRRHRLGNDPLSLYLWGICAWMLSAVCGKETLCFHVRHAACEHRTFKVTIGPEGLCLQARFVSCQAFDFEKTGVRAGMVKHDSQEPSLSL